MFLQNSDDDNVIIPKECKSDSNDIAVSCNFFRIKSKVISGETVFRSIDSGNKFEPQC